MSEIKDIPIIKTYNDFIKQLQEIEKSSTDIVLSYYKYCWTRNHNYKGFKELMIEELEPLGLKPYIHKFTKEMNIIFRFKRKAEAIVYVKEYGIDLLVYRL